VFLGVFFGNVLCLIQLISVIGLKFNSLDSLGLTLQDSNDLTLWRKLLKLLDGGV